MDPKTILETLAAFRPAAIPSGELVIVAIQENVFQLQVIGFHGEKQLYLVKWIAGGNDLGRNELLTARRFKRLEEIPAPPLLFEVDCAGGIIAGWAWLDGHDLRQEGRVLLPEAFACLGKLHRTMRNMDKLVSPASGLSYENVQEFISAESDRLCAPFDAHVRDRCLAILSRLDAGYPTLIHGDMHPGNIIVTREGIWFVDWSYACNSLNLFDLDYLQSYALLASGPEWSVIHPPLSFDVLEAYFEAIGMGQVDWLPIHHAVMIWNQLSTYENGIKNGFLAEASQTRQRLLALIQYIDRG